MQVSVLDGCSDSATTVACSGDYLSMPVSAGDTLLIAVEAYSPENAGPFTLRVMSRALDVCGDGYRDGSEDCDDGDLDPLDGCDDSCNLESTEEEPNGTTGTAGDYAAPHYGAIDPTDDVDVVSVTVASGPASIVASVSGFADDCITGAVDSLVEVLSSAGTPIGSDDDSGVGYCSRLVQTGVTAGTYYVRVSASPTGETPTFPYQLSIDVNRCGDGALGPGEQCDDGNQTPDDGCDGDCQSE
jgi:cysteine-rich repeat protein